MTPPAGLPRSGGMVLNHSNSAAFRVLIVDDNQDAADSLSCLLEMYQYEVRVAYSGQVGLATAQEFKPDCLLSDINMPGLDGFALAKQVRVDPDLANVKLVALSAYADEDYIRQATEAGFDYRLTKGCKPEKVLEIIRMIEEIKNLASKTQELAQQNVELAGQTKELIREVKEEVKEVKQEVKELKQEVKELREEHRNNPEN
jgi:two-component system, OmpR family, response regulator